MGVDPAALGRGRGAAADGDPESVRFEGRDVLERIDAHGDLFAPVLELEQELPESSGRGPRRCDQPTGWRTTGCRLAVASSRRRTGVV